MTISSSTMINGILINLGSASVLGNYVSTDYYVLEQTSDYAAVVSLLGTNFTPDTFGDPMSGRAYHTAMIEGYIRDINNPAATVESVAKLNDLIMNSLASDDTIQHSIDTITRINMRRNQNEAVSAGGHTWLPIYIEVEGYQFT